MTAMLICICSLVPAAAAEAEVPSESDTETVTVYGVEEGVTVTAYQLISAVYDSKGNGLTGYEAADGVTIEDMEYPTAEEITNVTKAIHAGTLALSSVQLSYEGEVYTAELSAGLWLILVSDANETVYNPMIVSNAYADANLASSLTAGTVDANGDFVEGAYANAIYAKKTSETLDKAITESDSGTGNNRGTELNVGDSVTFTITENFPDYSAAYDTDALTFTIIDHMSIGLTNITADDLQVSVGSTVYMASAVDSKTGDEVVNYTVTTTVHEDTSETFVIDFAGDFILAHAGESIEIVYTTTLDDDALTAEEGANTNEVQVTFSNTPTTTYDTDIIYNYVYTFALTDEVVKVQADGTASAVGTEVETSGGLEGAVFTFYTDAACTQIYSNEIFDGTAVTDEDGFVSVRGLAQGTYYFTETEAPEGYYINDTVYQLVIAAVFNEDGTLADYTLTVSELDEEMNVVSETAGTSTYVLSSTSSEMVVTASVNPTLIVDLQLTTLPSTGGMGLYVLIAGALLLFGLGLAPMLRRRRSAS